LYNEIGEGYIMEEIKGHIINDGEELIINGIRFKRIKRDDVGDCAACAFNDYGCEGFEIAGERIYNLCGSPIEHLVFVFDGIVDEITLSNPKDPYIIKSTTKTEDRYYWNPDYDQDKECECGDPYHRHFDSYEKMYPIGCKYCECMEFKEKKCISKQED
jgi:hypothetical protein